MSEARQAFADVVNRVAYGNERITVVRHGRELVAVVPISDLRQLETIDARGRRASGPGVPDAAARAPSRPRSGPRS